MKIYLFINDIKDTDLSVTGKIIDYLLSYDVEVLVDDFFYEKLDKNIQNKVCFINKNELSSDIDYAIVIGGDGTILRASKVLCKLDVPIVGINLGKVGYMAELEVDEYEILSSLFCKEKTNDAVKTDSRMMLSCNVLRNGKIVFSGECLNEAVIAKGDISRMIDLALEVDGEVLAEYQCDGIIAATPTGSTAYSMSAGGAIIDPKIECISMLPLSPYLSINSSPIIFSKDTKLEFVYRCVRHNSAYLSLDGGESIKLSDGDRVIITESPYITKLLRFKKTDFYKLLNAKLANRISELAQRA
ncbi:MAG: NAD(+)/NADH kinase [Clostridia bacterium]|nr:NAD(+)/NADH kinase [Clostridia bacterium]